MKVAGLSLHLFKCECDSLLTLLGGIEIDWCIAIEAVGFQHAAICFVVSGYRKT